jgi:hypothetical protein
MTKDQHNNYQHEYRKRKVHRVIIFSQAQYTFLFELAKKQDKPFGTFVRELALAQGKNEYVLPSDEATHSVKILLIKYGSNLNQLAHIANAKKEVSNDTIKTVQQEFLAMKDAIVKIYDKPIPVKELVRNTLITTPSYSEEIRDVLIQLKV